MEAYQFAAQQGRQIPKEDKAFGVSNRAKAMIARQGAESVVDATLGVLLDDDGKIVVLSPVRDVIRTLQPSDFAAYAPIAGIPAFREAVLRDAFGSFEPRRFTAAVASPGGTGAIRNAVGNYTERGESILITDWHWGPYDSVAAELGRGVRTFRLIDAAQRFDIEDFARQVQSLLTAQDRLLVILNTPANNPTGYSLSLADWKQVIDVLNGAPKEKKITLLADVAYLDFAGEETEVRAFLPLLDELHENILPLIAYSLSKSYTMYGMRCGALICMAPTKAIADEFSRVCEYAARATWSNCNRSAQTVLAGIYADPALLAKAGEERAAYRQMLLARGRAFDAAAREAGLPIVPYDAGFFATVPCETPDAVEAVLEAEGIFLLPLAKGLRVSIASVPEAVCRALPARILKAIEAGRKRA